MLLCLSALIRYLSFFFFAFPSPPKTNKYFQKRLYARSRLNNYNSLCALCYLEYTTCTKNLVTTWNCTWRNLEIACNKLSSTKVYVPGPLFGKDALLFDSCKRPLSLYILGGGLREV